MAELLIEIFTEELPAIPLLKNISNIEESWKKILQINQLETQFEFFYTPRRLTLLHKDFAEKQSDSKIKVYGPPLALAYNSNKPTKAMDSFLQKNNITLGEVSTAIKDNKEVLFYEKEVLGLESKEVLAAMVKDWLKSMQFGKSMRWGDCKDSFIRPIRNICIMLDSSLISCSAYNLQSSNCIYAHRQSRGKSAKEKIANDKNIKDEFENNMLNVAKKHVTSIESYLAFLAQNGVILKQDERKSLILRQIKEIEAKNQVSVELDNDLLQEIVAITEYPQALLGMFEDRFLKIPKEMIITSMKENQRYFAVYKNDGLFNGFIMVSNAFCGNFGLIVKGNEKVLRARLEDAMFFYTNDLQSSMSFGNLSAVGFMDGAGSLSDKVAREQKLAGEIIELVNAKYRHFSDNDSAIIMRALQYAKCDLLSNSVGEFPELQGIMGSYFARESGMDEELCLALREQYLPNGLNAELPSSKISAIVNIANKLDTIFTLFNIGKIPSGSKDPFALRRQAVAVLRISHQYGFRINIHEICSLAKDYQNLGQERLVEFMNERIYGIFPGVNPSIVRCVLLMQFDITQSFDKILALSAYFDSVDIKSVIGTFKRVANILNDKLLQSDKLPKDMAINTSLFEPSEQKLYQNLIAYENAKSKCNQALDSEAYIAQIQTLFQLKDDLDCVFDNVLIMADDMQLRANRVSLITLVFRSFMEFGDMRAIAI